MRSNKLEVIHHVTGNHSNPFRVIEVYECIDGCRTRMTHHCFPSLEEALLFILVN